MSILLCTKEAKKKTLLTYNVSGTIVKELYMIPKKSISQADLEEIKKELTLVPFVNGEIKQKLSYACWKEVDQDYIGVPRIYGQDVFGAADTDARTDGALIDSPNVLSQPYKEQEECIEYVCKELKARGSCCIYATCGVGKTCMSILIAAKMRRRTLVIVNSEPILNQWIESVGKFTDMSTGKIQRDIFEIDRDIVVAMVQTISKKYVCSDAFDDFGLIIWDEAHHISCKSFLKTLSLFKARNFLALTATKKRSDKLEFMLDYAISRNSFNMRRTVPIRVEVLRYTPPALKEIRNQWNGKINYVSMLSSLLDDEGRFNLIVNKVRNMRSMYPERRMLLLCNRKKYLQKLNKVLSDSCLYVGGGSKKQKRKRDDELKNGSKVILATTNIAAEGLDIPHPAPSILFFLSPVKSILEQAIGRITRGKNISISPIVVDIHDNFSIFSGMFYSRLKYYNSKKYKISF
jgi:superfamily II DNA or RNA helicase